MFETAACRLKVYRFTFFCWKKSIVLKRTLENMLVHLISTRCISITNVHLELKRHSGICMATRKKCVRNSSCFCSRRIRKHRAAKLSVWANHCTLHWLANWLLSRNLLLVIQVRWGYSCSWQLNWKCCLKFNCCICVKRLQIHYYTYYMNL